MALKQGLARSKPAVLEAIRREGLTKRSRHHVNLSADLLTAQAVGRYRSRTVVLPIRAEAMHADGYAFLQRQQRLADRCCSAHLYSVRRGPPQRGPGWRAQPLTFT
jgi:RNA:NAD 2'-phosphotransferase (TPT1/KptA family)